MSKTVFATVLLLCSHVAWGEPFTEQQLQATVKPEPGVATAKMTGNPPWCDVVGKIDSPSSPSSIYSESSGDLKKTLEAARDICGNATDPTWRRFAGAIVQKWMNWTKQSQADAERSIRARVQEDKWKAQHDQLCKALDVSPEAAAEAKTYADARLALFGCTNGDQPLWQDIDRNDASNVAYYFDSDLQTDPVIRVYWLYTYLWRSHDASALPSKDARENTALLKYAAAAPEFAKLDNGEMDKLMQAAPYNEYARIVMNETVSGLQARRAYYQTALDQLTKGDDDYTTILVKAPQQAYAAWDKLVAQYKPELERSEAFEKLWSAPSRKAMKGCSTQLLKDAEKVTKQYKDLGYVEMTDKLKADPLANLLFARLWVCTAFDNLIGFSGTIKQIVNDGRGVRGPRSMAQYAIVEAFAEASKDRPRMVLSLENFHAGHLVSPNNFDDHDFHSVGFIVPDSDRDHTVKGIVASTKKTSEGTKIIFKKTGFKYQNYECRDTNKPERIDDSGRIIYQQVCHNLPGTTSVDRTPDPVLISSELDGSVKPGVFISVETLAFEKSKAGEWLAVPMYTKKAPADLKITSYYGLPMQ